MSENEKTVLEMLLDPECEEDITLYDEEGNETVFGQAAVIPLGGVIYAILVPVTPIEGVGEGEGIVFSVDEEGETLNVVTDEATVDLVFDEYDKLCDEE